MPTPAAGSSSGSTPEIRYHFPDNSQATKSTLRGHSTPMVVFASGADQAMYVRWQKVQRAASTFESYLIQTKEAGETNWVVSAVVEDDRHGLSTWVNHRLTGLTNGTYEVRVGVRVRVGSGTN